LIQKTCQGFQKDDNALFREKVTRSHKHVRQSFPVSLILCFFFRPECLFISKTVSEVKVKKDGKIMKKKIMPSGNSRCQFHQHSMSSFCPHRSQEHKKD